MLDYHKVTITSIPTDNWLYCHTDLQMH